MRILKLEIEKKEKKSFLNIELDITGETSNYSVAVYNHINKKNKIDITNSFTEDKSIATANVDLGEIGIKNTTAIVIEIEDSSFNITKGVTVDTTSYFKCTMVELMKEVNENCDGCLPKTNDSFIQLTVLLNAFSDAYAIGAIDELFQLANMLDKLCNSNCTNCG